MRAKDSSNDEDDDDEKKPKGTKANSKASSAKGIVAQVKKGRVTFSSEDDDDNEDDPKSDNDSDEVLDDWPDKDVEENHLAMTFVGVLSVIPSENMN